MPIAIKDIIENRRHADRPGLSAVEGQESRPRFAGVHALREAGAVVLGKTTTTEFAATHRGTRLRTRTTASARRAARRAARPPAVGAVAWCRRDSARKVVGSILRPSSFCGAVGFKPSVGAINRSGSHDHFSQSCQGAIGATLADTWAVLRAIADRAGGDPGFVG
jgi:Asp-tRNA(Asn)/Glu-tRNA(Gln) amidotransferase A subunit family amidase